MKNLIAKIFTRRLFTKNRRVMSLMCAFVLGASIFVGCGNANNAGIAAANTDGISVVTTIFPEYDWVRQIVGDSANVDITMLLDNGVDLHSYQPNAEDIMKISTCDVFIYVGGESDEWVDDALKEATNKDMVVVDLLDVLGDSVKEEEVVEGMEAEEEAEGGEEEVEYDEHVWLSLKNTQTLVTAISDALGTVDAENASVYAENAAKYNEELAALDAQYQDAVDAANVNTILFGDRFPFRYLTDDYGLDYYAAFVGCSAESEASFETITFLAGKVDELGLNSVLTIENSDQKIAETIIVNTNSKDAKILTLDSMQSTTSADVEAGATYLGIMENNLSVLKEALQ
ncbi:metal ABC transporter substrate-binding protein [Pseudobutyrivibrio sp.]|uniref:metal ABC transporter substrate-binding protein n=1 Tax=Pseudobutyrivibrio sp. TaxID=2014367 RepID=UPI0025F1F127|nr:metal ABC transporter substrate-binding protein [Pseudobutyrivibrio sp.]